MKTERRHDLETNELARRLTTWIEAIKPYSSYLIGGLGVILGLAIVNSVWSSNTATKDQAAWNAYAMAANALSGNVSDIELVGLQRIASDDEYSGSVMREWAYAAWADRQVLLAATNYLFDREAVKDRLNRVIGIYQTLAEDAANQEIRNRSRLGLARIYEMQNKLDAALREYGLVQGDLATIASQRAEQLRSSPAEATYAWLAEAKLPPPTAGGPGTPGSQPAFDTTVPQGSAETAGPEMRTLEDILNSLEEEPSDSDRYDQETDEQESDDTSEAADSSTDGTPTTEDDATEP